MIHLRISWLATGAIFAWLSAGCIDATTFINVPDPGMSGPPAVDAGADDAASDDATSNADTATATSDGGGSGSLDAAALADDGG